MSNSCSPPKKLTFLEAIQKLKINDKPVLVKFFAPWCGACQEAKPAIHAAKCELGEDMETVAIDIDGDNLGMIAQEYGIESLPTVAIIHKGQVVAVTEGATTTQDYVDLARNYLKDNGYVEND